MYKQFLESLESRENELEDNITMIAHELNNPLACIKIFSTELRKKFPHLPNLVDTVNKIIQYTNLCLFNIQFRKDNLRKFKSKKRDDLLNVKKFIYKCVDDFKAIYNETIKIEINGTSFSLKSNFLFLSTIFTNLLHNSCYFIKKSGKGSVLITIKENQKENIIIFRDTACGIKPDLLPYIFDKGFSRRKDGTGMGLYMCRDLIEHLGGTITCESKLNEYTNFIIKFPKNLSKDS